MNIKRGHIYQLVRRKVVPLSLMLGCVRKQTNGWLDLPHSQNVSELSAVIFNDQEIEKNSGRIVYYSHSWFSWFLYISKVLKDWYTGIAESYVMK